MKIGFDFYGDQDEPLLGVYTVIKSKNLIDAWILYESKKQNVLSKFDDMSSMKIKEIILRGVSSDTAKVQKGSKKYISNLEEKMSNLKSGWELNFDDKKFWLELSNKIEEAREKLKEMYKEILKWTLTVFTSDSEINE